MELDPFKFMQRFSIQITFATVGADDDRYVLDHEQVGPLAIAACHMSDVCPSVTTDIASESVCFHVIQDRPLEKQVCLSIQTC